VIEVRGAVAAQRRFASVAKKMPQAAQRGCDMAALYLVGYMKENYLSGQRLNVRTGKLRSNWQTRQVGGGRIATVVSTNTVYAPIHEFGFSGTVQVKAHPRRQNNPDGKQLFDAFGNRLKPGPGSPRRVGRARRPKGPKIAWQTFKESNPRNLRVRLVSKWEATTGGTVTMVRAHSRHVNVPAKRFLRDTVEGQGERAFQIARSYVRKAAK